MNLINMDYINSYERRSLGNGIFQWSNTQEVVKVVDISKFSIG